MKYFFFYIQRKIKYLKYISIYIIEIEKDNKFNLC